MIYKFIDDSKVLEFTKDELECHVKICDVLTNEVLEVYLSSEDIYNMIGALYEVKKRIEKQK